MTSQSREETPSPLEQLLFWCVLVPTCILPLVVSPRGADVFRVPKELLLRAQGILIASALLAILIVKRGAIIRTFTDRTTAIAIAAFAMVPIIATIASTNRAISITSLAFVGSCFLLFLGTYVIAERISLRAALWVGMGASLPNALLAVSQRLGWWNPFAFAADLEPRMRITALIGNPNDVGAYLATCAIIMIGFAFIDRTPFSIALSVLLVLGVVVADSVTAIGALMAGVAALGLIVTKRRALAISVMLLIVIAATIPNRQRIVDRYDDVLYAVEQGHLQALSSNRLVAFLVAWEVFRDHPVLGAGPGTFRWHYLPYRLRVEQRHPRYYLTSIENFGEVHNDHLQILAEEGLVGYLTFLLGAGLIIKRAFNAHRPEQEKSDKRLRFARIVALPLVTTFLVLALATFPLELAAVVTQVVFFSSLILRWSSVRESD